MVMRLHDNMKVIFYIHCFSISVIFNSQIIICSLCGNKIQIIDVGFLPSFIIVLN